MLLEVEAVFLAQPDLRVVVVQGFLRDAHQFRSDFQCAFVLLGKLSPLRHQPQYLTSGTFFDPLFQWVRLGLIVMRLIFHLYVFLAVGGQYGSVPQPDGPGVEVLSTECDLSFEWIVPNINVALEKIVVVEELTGFSSHVF